MDYAVIAIGAVLMLCVGALVLACEALGAWLVDEVRALIEDINPNTPGGR